MAVCLFHGDYGPADPGFSLAAHAAAQGWVVDVRELREARNLGEAQAIQRHLLRGETVSWCHPGYSWVDQSVIVWFYAAAFLFVVLPYLLIKIGGWGFGFRRIRTPSQGAEEIGRYRS
jgi:hypothetical protein